MRINGYVCGVVVIVVGLLFLLDEADMFYSWKTSNDNTIDNTIIVKVEGTKEKFTIDTTGSVRCSFIRFRNEYELVVLDSLLKTLKETKPILAKYSKISNDNNIQEYSKIIGRYRVNCSEILEYHLEYHRLNCNDCLVFVYDIDYAGALDVKDIDNVISACYRALSISDSIENKRELEKQIELAERKRIDDLYN